MLVDKLGVLYYKTDMISITEEKFLESPKEAIRQAQSSNEILNVVSNEGGYVIIDSEEWQNIRETIHLNSIKEPIESTTEASKKTLKDTTPLKDLAGKLKWKGDPVKAQRELRDEW